MYEDGEFIMSIRYYKHKVNLYLLNGRYFEVFIDHKSVSVDKIIPLEKEHSRFRFYTDQISFENPLKKTG